MFSASETMRSGWIQREERMRHWFGESGGSHLSQRFVKYLITRLVDTLKVIYIFIRGLGGLGQKDYALL